MKTEKENVKDIKTGEIVSNFITDDLYLRVKNERLFLNFKTPIILKKANSPNWITYSFYPLVVIISILFRFKDKIPSHDIFISLMGPLVLALIIMLFVATKEKNLQGLSKTIGKIVSFKIHSVRNYPNWDSIIITTLCLFLPIFITFANDEKSFTMILAAFSVYVWNQKNRKSSIYNNCYNAYNKYLERPVETTENKETNKIIANSLAIDILHYDLWGHKSFSEFFLYQILSSLKCIIKSNQERLIPDSLSNCINIIEGTKSLNRLALEKEYRLKESFTEQDIDYILNLSFQIRNNLRDNEAIDS